MSIPALRAVFGSTLKPTKRFVLTSFAWHEGPKTGETYPSLRTVERDTGLNHATVVLATDALVKAGVLIIVRASRGGRPVIYRINYEALKRSHIATVQQSHSATQ